MGVELTWMRPHAPYMPIVTVGLLSLLAESGEDATACWTDGTGPALTLRIDTRLDAGAIGTLIAEAPWPSLNRIQWPDGRWSQGLKPTLKSCADPADAFRQLVGSAPPLEAKLLRAILTDGVLDDDGIPARSRLLRGVKADLSCVSKRPKRIVAAGVTAELLEGPDFRSGESGLGLGLVPEVQTFGGTTGPNASSVGAYSPLLYLLLWRGIMALPPVPVAPRGRRVVGGALVTAPDVLSWPRWRISVGLPGLRTLLSHSQVHAARPPHAALAARGIDAVYRVRATPLNSMVAVFRWATEVGS